MFDVVRCSCEGGEERGERRGGEAQREVRFSHCEDGMLEGKCRCGDDWWDGDSRPVILEGRERVARRSRLVG